MDNNRKRYLFGRRLLWGMEQLMQSIPGVLDAESGYANGTCEADADYQTVCRGIPASGRPCAGGVRPRNR